jgi:hypothetical protein
MARAVDRDRSHHGPPTVVPVPTPGLVKRLGRREREELKRWQMAFESEEAFPEHGEPEVVRQRRVIDVQRVAKYKASGR